MRLSHHVFPDTFKASFHEMKEPSFPVPPLLTLKNCVLLVFERSIRPSLDVKHISLILHVYVLSLLDWINYYHSIIHLILRDSPTRNILHFNFTCASRYSISLVSALITGGFLYRCPVKVLGQSQRINLFPRNLYTTSIPKTVLI